MDEVKRPVESAIVKKRNQTFSEEELQNAWSTYVARADSKGQFNFYATLRASTIVSEQNALTIEVLNKLQAEQIREAQLELMQFFSEELKNDELTLEIQVKTAKQESVNTQFMNDRERYEAMTKKHPALDELRKRLDLDLMG